jgi:hypothetical protein
MTPIQFFECSVEIVSMTLSRMPSYAMRYSHETGLPARVEPQGIELPFENPEIQSSAPSALNICPVDCFYESENMLVIHRGAEHSPLESKIDCK